MIKRFARERIRTMKLKWSNIMPPIKLERKNYSDYKINLNTLRPITYWKVPKKLQTLINTVYNEYSHNKTANCFKVNSVMKFHIGGYA